MCGRTLFDFTEEWGGRQTMDVPVVVVTHRVPTDWVQAHPKALFYFVTEGMQLALVKAKETAGERTAAAPSRCRSRRSAEVGQPPMPCLPLPWDDASVAVTVLIGAPDSVLLDIALPGTDRLAVFHALTDAGAGAAVVLTPSGAVSAYRRRLRRSQAPGIVPKGGLYGSALQALTGG